MVAVHWSTRSGIADGAVKSSRWIGKSTEAPRASRLTVPFVFEDSDLVLPNRPTLDFLPSFSSASE